MTLKRRGILLQGAPFFVANQMVEAIFRWRNEHRGTTKGIAS